MAHLARSVLLVDDHPLFRKGLCMMLSTKGLMPDELHEAGSLLEALELNVNPDLVLLDISMPGGDGLSGIARLHERWPGVKVVILSGYDHQELMQDAARSGARGFMSKAMAPEVICERVQQWLKPGLQDEAFEIVVPSESAGQLTGEAEPVLPPRQYEVLKLVAQGFSNKAIARRLEVSEHTVRNQLVTILRHFGAQTRTQAVANAQRDGVLPAAFLKS